ncbi:amino acid permease [Candidatus Aerophobetes bacterium]|uniref:Amino acid permease n=1 Tax=Aerophobetes bacterium TaxID=2030807 RepID=A0A2A4X5G8_UNCAE|nr:MAG: amino acid permease [Candidatus Aerophobetes bacterium]
MTKKAKPLGIYMLAMINVAAILSIKNWPMTAEYGATSIFYFLIGALLFFVPVSLVSAELATTLPEKGGLYLWVKTAMGHRVGFLAIYLAWISNVIWYPTVLSFIAGTLAFVITPSLANNNTYVFTVILLTFYGATYINLKGMRISGWMSSFGAILGTLVPGALIIILGAKWLFGSQVSHLTFTMDTLVPSLNEPARLAILAGVLLGFAGMEMSAVHAKDVDNPRKNYPKAILLSALIILIFSILGTLSIATVLPPENINLVAGSMEAIGIFMESFHMQWLTPIIALLIALGALASVSTWAIGPSKGLLEAANDGDLPACFHKTNKANVPSTILLCQALVVTVVSAVFLYFPDVNSSFWILITLSSLLYILCYILIFTSAIILKYKANTKNLPRPYRVPGKNIGMWIVSGIGIVTCISIFILGFLPPEHLSDSEQHFFVSFLVIGLVIFSLIPFLILLGKHKLFSKK